jgi:hypothetical protein
MIIIIPDAVLTSDINRLTNQLWKLIPMRENEEDWLNHLNYLIVELAGLNELCSNADEKFLILLSKLKGLQIEDTVFQVYRKTVFECISLLREMRL